MPGYRRGRRRGKRRVGWTPVNTYFSTEEGRSGSEVVLRIEEVEALRLVDLANLTQQQAADEMGVSRKTLWKDLKNARRKVAKALTEGKSIRIKGGSYSLK